MRTESVRGAVRRPAWWRRNGPDRPSVSPLAWIAAASWAGSRAGTELALWAWQSGQRAPVLCGCLLVAALTAVSLLARRVVLRWTGLAAALAVALALGSGSALSATAAALDANGTGTWPAQVVSDPRESLFGMSVTVRLHGVPGTPAVRVGWPEKAPLPAYGQLVVIEGRLKVADRATAASADAFRNGEVLRSSPWRVRVTGWAAPPFGAVAAWRADSIDALRRIGGRGGQALAAMLFGAPVRDEGVDALEDARTAGVAWAITASGLHLGVIILLAERLAGAAGAGRRGRAVAALGALAVIAAAAGMRMSLLRAALAAAAAVLGRLAGRRRDATAALGAAVTLLVLVDPAAACDAGLLLGVAAVSGITLLSGVVKTWLAPVVGRRASWMLGGSVAAQVAVAPLAAGLFGAVSVLGPVTLAVSGPPVQVAVALGALGAGALPLWPAAGTALLRAGTIAAEAATRLWQLVARVPGALVAVAAPPWWLAGAWIALGFGLWLRWPRPRRAARVRIGVGAVILALVWASSLGAHTTGCVQVLDVGQGDAILIRDGGHAVLVDTGPEPVALRQALGRAGVRELDGLVLSHAHDDHTGGLKGLAGVARPRWIGVPDVEDEAVAKLAQDAADLADEVVGLRQGMEFTVGRVTVRVLWPRGGEARLPANDTSVILLLERDGQYAVLLGDAEDQAQRGALEVWSAPIQMLKVAHHGSVNGNVPAALDAWHPRFALISVGQGNKFGHPTSEALADLARVGAVVRRTDLEGDLSWDPGVPQAAGVAERGGALCDNRWGVRPHADPAPTTGQVSPWQPQASTISSRSISSTALRSCCWSVRRSDCTTAWRPSPTSISTSRPSTVARPPPTTSPTPRTPCRS